MGFLTKVIGAGAIIAGLSQIKKSIKEEKRRKSIICRFDGNVSEEEFYSMVRHSAKGIKRLADLRVDNTIVYGKVRSQSGLSEWQFQIDFNDYGVLTGSYWIFSDNNDSSLPTVLADQIAQQIKAISN